MRLHGPDVMASQAVEMGVRSEGCGVRSGQIARRGVSSPAWLPVPPGTLRLANRVLVQRLLLSERFAGGAVMQVALASLGGRSIYCAGAFHTFVQAPQFTVLAPVCGVFVQTHTFPSFMTERPAFPLLSKHC